MARLKIDPNQLGNEKATNQSKRWYVYMYINTDFQKKLSTTNVGMVIIFLKVEQQNEITSNVQV